SDLARHGAVAGGGGDGGVRDERQGHSAIGWKMSWCTQSSNGPSEWASAAQLCCVERGGTGACASGSEPHPRQISRATGLSPEEAEMAAFEMNAKDTARLGGK